MAQLIVDMAKISDGKREHRRARARLPFPEKIRLLVELQKRYAPIRRARGASPRIWQVDGPTDRSND